MRTPWKIIGRRFFYKQSFIKGAAAKDFLTLDASTRKRRFG